MSTSEKINAAPSSTAAPTDNKYAKYRLTPPELAKLRKLHKLEDEDVTRRWRADPRPVLKNGEKENDKKKLNLRTFRKLERERRNEAFVAEDVVPTLDLPDKLASTEYEPYAASARPGITRISGRKPKHTESVFLCTSDFSKSSTTLVEFGRKYRRKGDIDKLIAKYEAARVPVQPAAPPPPVIPDNLVQLLPKEAKTHLELLGRHIAMLTKKSEAQQEELNALRVELNETRDFSKKMEARLNKLLEKLGIYIE